MTGVEPFALVAMNAASVQAPRMKWIGTLALIAASLVANSVAFAQSPQPVVGESHEITVSYQTTQNSSDGSSGSSNGHDMTLERVIAVTDLGLELEYDLPQTATDEARARIWQYPARIFRPQSGPARLLNRDDLEARLDLWLAAAGWTREACGRWIFTWNAFRIECDPESVLATVEALDLRSVDLRDGATYRHPDTLGTGSLTRTMAGQDGASFSVELEVDADSVRRARAESDVAVGEIMQQPVTLEEALRERSDETISGSVQVTFDVDAAGAPTRRTVVTTLETVDADGVSGTDRSTVVLERRPVSGLHTQP